MGISKSEWDDMVAFVTKVQTRNITWTKEFCIVPHKCSISGKRIPPFSYTYCGIEQTSGRVYQKRVVSIKYIDKDVFLMLKLKGEI